MKRLQNEKRSADPLDRLLHSAAQANIGAPEVSPLSWTAQSAVLGAWRASRVAPNNDSWLAFFRTGVALAGAAALLTVLVTYRINVHDGTSVNDEVEATHAAFNVAVLN